MYIFFIQPSRMPRTSLHPINPNRTREPKLTPYIRGFIRGLLAAGVTPTKIGEELQIQRATVRYILQQKNYTRKWQIM